MSSDYKDVVFKACETFRLDINLVNAIIQVESAGNTFKARFEPQWKYFNNVSAFAAKLYITQQTEQMLQATSFGLMQVMGAVARDLAFQSDLLMLTLPEVGVFYGCKKLRQLFDRYGEEQKVIAAYNAGSATTTAGGMFINEQYVDKVNLVLREYRQLKLQ